MTINIKDFLDIITYNKLHSYVMLPSPIAALLVIDDPEHKICYCEPFNLETTIVWYPTEEWIIECKRRKSIDDTLLQSRVSHSTIRPYTAPTTLEQVEAQMIKAAISGNITKLKQLQEQLKEIQQQIQTK